MCAQLKLWVHPPFWSIGNPKTYQCIGSTSIQQVNRVTPLYLELPQLHTSFIVQGLSTTKGCHTTQVTEVSISFKILWMSACPRNTFEVVAYFPVWVRYWCININQTNYEVAPLMQRGFTMLRYTGKFMQAQGGHM
jgi:hypothetical protein